MRRHFLPTLLALVAFSGTLRGDGAASPEWESLGSDGGIAVFRREVPGSPVIAFKGDGVVDASIATVASVLIDTSRATEWIDSLVDARPVRKISETEYVEYDHVGTPFVMKDRDFVIDTKLELDPASKKVILKMHSVTDAAAPKSDYVRGELIHSSFVLVALDHGKRTRVIAEIHCDPKGSVAKWIVNWFQKSWPKNTLEALRAQAKKPDIKENPELRQALVARGFFD
jgi:START domain